MPNAIAFFPWTYVAEPTTVGRLRLLPYTFEVSPGDLPNVTQADIDGMLGAYAERPNTPVHAAALMEIDDWYSGQDASAEVRDKLRVAQQYLAFSALAQRELFSRRDNYTNYHTYSMVIQGFRPGDPGTFAFYTRRRDGGTHQVWSNDMFAFHRPEHVVVTRHMEFDQDLLQALLELPDSHGHYLEAIREFNAANTDSYYVPDDAELVMCKSAFEWLFNINSDSKRFIEAVRRTLADIPQVQVEGPLREQWLTRHPKYPELILAWAKDFAILRGSSAHGAADARVIYGKQQHLAFSSMFFPLMVKKLLADDGRLTLSELDIDVLTHLESYLVHDPFAHDWLSEDLNPWADAHSMSFVRSKAHRFYPDMVD